MTHNKKQNKALVTCVILLLIAGSIFIAVAFGVGRRARPGETGNTTHTSDIDTGREDPMPEGTDASTAPADKDTASDGSTTGKQPTAEQVPEETIPTSLSVDDINFIAPADGAVLVSCSLTVPVYSLTMNDYRTHAGVDIATQAGAPVTACAAGVVTSVFADPMMGMTVVVNHAEGVESVYKNLAEELPENVVVGCELDAGDVIGAVGDTALIECEEESHLHFELKVNGENVDPLEYIEMVSINEIYED